MNFRVWVVRAVFLVLCIVFVVAVSLLIYRVNSSGLGAFFGATTASGMAFYLARYYTRKREKAEATFKFTEQFQKLAEAQHKLNIRFCYDHKAKHCDSNGEKTRTDKYSVEAWSLFRQYFNLLAQEFHFFRKGLVDRDTMIEWMKWRWYGWNPKRVPRRFASNPMLWDGAKNGSEICGVPFKEGWDWWKNRPVADEYEFTKFLNQIHDAESEDAMVSIVQRWPQTTRVQRIFK